MPEDEVPAAPPASGRPARVRKTPAYLKDYELSEMSLCQEIRRPTSYMVEDVGVGGMLEDDILGSVESRLREAATRDAGPIVTCAGGSSGRDEPGNRSTCVGRILIGMKDLCRDNGLDESVTAEMVGQLAMDLCDFPI